MSQHRLTLAELQELLDTFGEELAKWPPAEQARARQLLSRSPKAAAMVAEAKAIRAALKSGQKKAPSGLTDRIVARAMQASPPKKRADRKPRLPAKG
jgi:hypothetical protein